MGELNNYTHNQPPAMQPGNWIAVSRDMRDHPVVGFGKRCRPAVGERFGYSRSEAWQDLIMEAQYRPSRYEVSHMTIWLEVGQLLGARDFLARRWNWTEKAVRTFLDRLEVEGMIVREQPDKAKVEVNADRSQKTGQPKGHQGATQKGQRNQNLPNVITLCNYSKYQRLVDAVSDFVDGKRANAPAEERPTEGPPTGQQEASKGPDSNNLTIKQTTTSPARERENEAAKIEPDPNEIEGLNGNTAAFVKQLAEAESQYAPDYETARTLIQSSVNHYGADIVGAAFLQWQTAIADKQARAMKNPFRSLPNYIEALSRSRAAAAPAKKREKITSFSDIIKSRLAEQERRDEP